MQLTALEGGWGLGESDVRGACEEQGKCGRQAKGCKWAGRFTARARHPQKLEKGCPESVFEPRFQTS